MKVPPLSVSCTTHILCHLLITTPCMSCTCNLVHVSTCTFLVMTTWVSHSRAQLTMLKNSIIRMTSLMHHVHVNHLEQESITHINEAVQYIPHPHPHPHPTFTSIKIVGSICNVEHSTQKYAWAFISLYVIRHAVYIYVHVCIICTSNTANATHAESVILPETEHPEISQSCASIYDL